MAITFDELKAMDKEFLTPKEAADFLGMDPQALRYTARMAPQLLGFPVICYQTEGKVTWHYKVPRRALISYIERGQPWVLPEAVTL